MVPLLAVMAEPSEMVLKHYNRWLASRKENKLKSYFYNWRNWAITQLVISIFYAVVIYKCFDVLRWLVPLKHSGLIGAIGYYLPVLFLFATGLVHLVKLIRLNGKVIRRFGLGIKKGVEHLGTLNSTKPA